MRETVLSWVFSAQTAPSPTATLLGAVGGLDEVGDLTLWRVYDGEHVPHRPQPRTPVTASQHHGRRRSLPPARWVEGDRCCIEVIAQISAIQGALEKDALGLLGDHTRHCVLGPESEELRECRAEELVAAFGRLLGRS
jgi:DNA-binding FrmR family transcriptional regulator